MKGLVLKNGVSISGLVPEMVLANFIVTGIMQEHGQDPVITSGTDGKHSKKSRHYIGCATDWRTWYLQEASKEEEVVEDIKKALGKEFTIVLHKRSHIHVQFDGSSRAF